MLMTVITHQSMLMTSIDVNDSNVGRYLESPIVSRITHQSTEDDECPTVTLTVPVLIQILIEVSKRLKSPILLILSNK